MSCFRNSASQDGVRCRTADAPGQIAGATRAARGWHPSSSLTSLLALSLSLLVMAGCSNQSDLLVEIRELQEGQQYAKTIEPLRAMLDEDPNQPEVNFLLGRALVRTGDSSSAIWPLRRAMESPEHLVEAGLMLARAELSSRTPRDVLDAVERVLAVEPENTSALTLRAQGYLKANQPVDALRDLDRVLELDPENLEALVPRVTTLIQLDLIEDAEAALVRANEVIETTEQEVRPQLRGRMCVANALFAHEKGEAEKAMTLYEECLEAYPTNQLVVSEAVRHFDGLKQVDRATEVLEKAFEESNSAFFRSALARRMGRLGKADEQERLLLEEAEERPTPKAWFELGDFYVLQERYDEACGAFEKSLAAQGDPAPMTRFAYVDTLIQAERFDDARRETEKVEQEYMRNLLEGRLLLATGDAAGALRQFEAGLLLWPDNSTARFFAGQAAEQLGDFNRAVEEYREAIRKRQNTGETDAALHLAQILFAKGRAADAYSHLHRFIATHPRREESLILMIHVAQAIGRDKLIAQSLGRLLTIGKPGLAMEQQISLLAASAGPEAAIKAAYKSGMHFTDPANVMALRALIDQLAVMNRHDEAREGVAAALAAHPDSADFHALSGRASLAAGGKDEEAKAAFQRALELEPEHPMALMGLAELAAASGGITEAIELYDRAYSADEDDPSAARAAAALLTADDQFAEREERLAAMVARDPRDSFAANELAKSLATRGADLDRALSYARRAAYFENPREAKETLGWVQLLRGEYSRAIEVLQAVVAARPEAGRARYRLGLAQKAAGQLKPARESFEAVIAAGSAESEDARNEIARMDSPDSP